MGLDTSHGCWNGAHSAFHRWRCKVAEVVGIDLEQMDGFFTDGKGNWIGGIPWETLAPDVLHVLLKHSDCDGIIEWKYTKPLADRLTELLPLLEKEGRGGGHVGLYSRATEKFIAGLLRAHKAKENVEFR